MTKEQIIEQILENTDWEAIKKMRDIFMVSQYGKTAVILSSTELKNTGKELLIMLLNECMDTNGEAKFSTACLNAYKDLCDGIPEYGIRFEASYMNASVYIEDDDILDADLILDVEQ